tara:strand:- start:592 stop:1779 length:1188 start_codon:yes stop_codon:yes gene_type:complete
MQFRTLFVVGFFGLLLCTPVYGDEPKIETVETVEAQGLSEETLLANARVREVIGAMNDAIEAGDVGAYMSRIDPSQAVFLTEQRAWITDSILEGVQAIEYAFLEVPGVTEHANDALVARIGIRWSLDGDGPLRGDEPWNMVYMARFVPLGSAEGGWVFAGPAWHFDLYDEATNVRVLATEDHEANAQLALERAPEILTMVEEDFGKDLSTELVIKVYKKMKSLQASISPAYTDPLAGWNEPGESIKILGRSRVSKASLDPLLAHEIGHAVSFEFGPEINKAPWWTLEGIAEVAAGLFRDSWESKNRRITNMAKKDNLREWEQLADFKGEATDHAMHVYLQGWSMIDYIDRTFGKDQRNAWFSELGTGATLDQASMRTLGLSFDELDAQWYQSLMD